MPAAPGVPLAVKAARRSGRPVWRRAARAGRGLAGPGQRRGSQCSIRRGRSRKVPQILLFFRWASKVGPLDPAPRRNCCCLKFRNPASKPTAQRLCSATAAPLQPPGPTRPNPYDCSSLLQGTTARHNCEIWRALFYFAVPRRAGGGSRACRQAGGRRRTDGERAERKEEAQPAVGWPSNGRASAARRRGSAALVRSPA